MSHVSEPEALIRVEEVCRRTTLNRSTLYRAIAQGTFPRPVKITARASAWRVSEVNDWIRARPARGAAA